jgi:hypothetical protein
MSSVTITIMAHPSRTAWAEELATELECEITWDQVGHAWDTGKRAMLYGVESGASNVCIIQDDVILSEGVRSSVEALVHHSGDNPVSLYAGDGPRTKAAMKHNPDPWYASTGPIWGPGVIIPTAHVPEIIRFGDMMRMTSYDTRLWRFYQRHRVWCYYTAPSLVQHRIGHGSLISRGRDRQAPFFGSGLGKDWSVPPMILDDLTLHPRVTLEKDGRRKVARRHTKTWRIAVAQGWTEEEPEPIPAQR